MVDAVSAHQAMLTEIKIADMVVGSGHRRDMGDLTTLDDSIRQKLFHSLPLPLGLVRLRRPKRGKRVAVMKIVAALDRGEFSLPVEERDLHVLPAKIVLLEERAQITLPVCVHALRRHRSITSRIPGNQRGTGQAKPPQTWKSFSDAS